MMKIAKKILDFQTKVRTVEKNQTGYGYKYASLEQIISSISQPLEETKLIYYHSVRDDYMVCSIIDVDSGESIESITPMVKLDLKGLNSVQSLGAVMTYLRRYTLISALGLVTDEDTDGVYTPTQKVTEDKPWLNPILKDGQLTPQGEKMIDSISNLGAKKTIELAEKKYKISNQVRSWIQEQGEMLRDEGIENIVQDIQV